MPDTAAKSLVGDVTSVDRGTAAEHKAGESKPSSLAQPSKPSAVNDVLRQGRDELLLNIKEELVPLGKELLAAPSLQVHCRKFAENEGS